jgi:hypothetical protein
MRRRDDIQTFGDVKGCGVCREITWRPGTHQPPSTRIALPLNDAFAVCRQMYMS